MGSAQFSNDITLPYRQSGTPYSPTSAALFGDWPTASETELGVGGPQSKGGEGSNDI